MPNALCVARFVILVWIHKTLLRSLPGWANLCSNLLTVPGSGVFGLRSVAVAQTRSAERGHPCSVSRRACCV